MSERDTLRLAVLSAVRHAASYLPIFTAELGLEIRVIGEELDAPDWMHEDARVLADRYHVPIETDIEHMLARSDIDLVLICSEPARHARLAERALLAGKHVIVDKPMATTPADCERLAAVAATADGRFTVMHRLFTPAIQQVRGAIDAGHLGLIRSIDVEWLASDGLSGEAVERPELVADPALSGGGELMNFLVYPISYLRYLTGAEVVEVFAESGTFFFEPHRRYGVEDLGVLSLRLEHDIVATVTVGRVPRAASPGHLGSSLRLIGSHGHMTVDEQRPALEVWGVKERRDHTIGGEPGTRAVVAAISEFLRDIREDRPPLFSADDGWATVAAIDAAYRSVATGQPAMVAPRSKPAVGRR